MREATFTIPANKTYSFDANIRKLNKKAVVARAEGKFVATYGNPYPRTIQIDEAGRKTRVTFIDVTVTGPDFAIGNHTLVTMADFDDVNNPTFNDFVADNSFADYKSITRTCEHCNTNRARRKIFILLNNDNGEFVQVGKSCLKDYLGHSIFDAIKGCNLWLGMSELEESLYGEYVRGSGMGEDVLHVLTVAAHMIRKNGYTSRAEAEEKWTKATADQVRDNLNRKDLTDEDKTEAADVLEWAKAEFVFDADDARKNSSFVLNVENALENSLVENKMIGLIACLPALKRRAEERAAREEANGKSEHFGEIKKREEFDVEVVGVNYIDGTYGVTTLYTMLVGTNVAKWFSSRDVLDNGKKYTLKATVKAHDEFNGTKQTVLTRCAIQ